MNYYKNFFILILFFVENLDASDITNVDELLQFFKNSNSNHSIGFLTEANANAVKRYMVKNMNVILFKNREELLKAVDDEQIIAAVMIGSNAEDLQPKYHVFSSNIVSPQAMILTPNYDSYATPYGLKNGQNEDLFQALNAAIIQMQTDGEDEKLFNTYNRTDIIRAYTCRQDGRMSYINRNETRGFLREILLENKTLRIGGVGKKNWGHHDGNYLEDPPVGLYPELLNSIVKKLEQLTGPDKTTYSTKIHVERIVANDNTELFRALMNGSIHATDVYTFIDVSYDGIGETCKNNSDCRRGNNCINGFCAYEPLPRSLFFRSTCTIAAVDSKFITKKSRIDRTDKTQSNNSNGTRPSSKMKWIGYLLVLTVLFGSVFLVLLIFLRRKTNTRFEHTNPGGFGKFVRLQEDSEPNMEIVDSFDDQVIQSPRETNNPTN